MALAREAPRFIMRLAGQCHCARLSSDVRPRNDRLIALRFVSLWRSSLLGSPADEVGCSLPLHVLPSSARSAVRHLGGL